jgi:hypothetical protein
MKVVFATVVCGAVLFIAGAPVAEADSSEYLSLLEGERFYQTLGATTLLREGNKVCDAIENGADTVAAAQMVEADLNVSPFAGGEIAGAAMAGLGC